MENNFLQNVKPTGDNRGGFKLGIKLVVIAAISLLLLIPQSIIMNMVNERSDTEQSANLEVSEKWGGGQKITGPVLFIPGDTSSHNVYLLPEALDVSGNIGSRMLKRGIFDFTVYEATVELSGHFALPKELKAEQSLLTYGVLACLKGLKEQGCNGPVTEAIGKIEKHLNQQAHK